MKQEIEIESLPEGWRAIAYRTPKINEFYLYQGGIELANVCRKYAYLIVEKIQPRRIVLEETEELRMPEYGEYFDFGNGDIRRQNSQYEQKYKIWKVVE